MRWERLLASLPAHFSARQDPVEREDVTDAIRAEAVSAAASEVASIPSVRQGLMRRQQAFRRPPGLVADGRDMGSVVFPDAQLKVFLTASAEERARRRHKQLIEKGIDANLSTLLQDIRQRDARDSERSVAPLQKSVDAQIIDTTGLSIQEVVDQILQWFESASRQGPIPLNELPAFCRLQPAARREFFPLWMGRLTNPLNVTVFPRVPPLAHEN